jgi:hypothetical protein
MSKGVTRFLTVQIEDGEFFVAAYTELVTQKHAELSPELAEKKQKLVDVRVVKLQQLTIEEALSGNRSNEGRCGLRLR